MGVQETLQQKHLLHVCGEASAYMRMWPVRWLSHSGCPLASDEKHESENSACKDAKKQPSPVSLVWSVFVSSSKNQAVFGPVMPVLSYGS